MICLEGGYEKYDILSCQVVWPSSTICSWFIKKYQLSFIGNDEIYLSKKYIKKHKDNIVFNLNKLVDDVMERKIHQGLLAMTIL